MGGKILCTSPKFASVKPDNRHKSYLSGLYYIGKLAGFYLCFNTLPPATSSASCVNESLNKT